MIKHIKNLWTASVARQLILGIALVHALLMSIFVTDLVSRQRDFMTEQNTIQAIGLAETLSANGISWLLSNDFIGLEEVIRSQSHFPGLDYAMFIDMNGKVLGYTERDKVGLYIKDKISQILLSSRAENKVLINNPFFVDVASPVISSGTQIGWARVGVNRQEIIHSLDFVTIKGIIYTLTAIAVGIIFAWFMANGLTSAIRQLTNALQQIIQGRRDVECMLDRQDEMGVLSRDFNLMLQSIIQQEEKIKKTSAALAESEVKFHRLVDNLSTEYFLFSRDINDVFTYVTPSVTSVLGYSVDEFKIHSHSFLTGHPVNETARKHMQRSSSGELEPSYEIEAFHKNDDKLWLNISELPVFDQQGHVVAVEGIAHDISQKKHFETILLDKEQEQSEILDNMLDGVLTLDEQGRITSCNHAAQKLFGYQASELMGKSFDMLFSASSLYSLVPHTSSEINTEKDIFERIGFRRKNTNEMFVDVEAEDKQGDVFPVRLSLAQLLKSDNVNRSYICSCSDLTQQKHHEERLRRSQKMDALGKLTGGIAHDFNNMLGVIIGYSDLLLMSAGQQPKTLKFVQEIRHAGERGKRLTQKLLGFSRRKEIESECVDLNELLKDNHHMLAKSITSKIELKYQLANDLWTVWFDKGDMEDTLVNLSINAMHAMPDGGKLTIETTNTLISPELGTTLNLPSGEYVHLSVMDNGTGMDEKVLNQIFDPFFTTKDDMGTGLGLSQVYGFVQRSGGTINVYSEKGHGSCFSLYFPRYKGGADDVNTQSRASVKDWSQQDLKGKGELILLIDDEKSLLSFSEQVLLENGYYVVTAENADRALELLAKNRKEKQKITLMISDVVMPGMDGYQLSEIVQERYPDIKIQLSSGFNDDRHLQYQNQLLHDNLLPKPYSANELLLKVKELLDE